MDKRISSVRDGYDKAADDYLRGRNQFNNFRYLEELAGMLTPGSRILDIGCGAGLPIDGYLVKQGYKLTGIDVSGRQIDLARKNVPEGEFRVMDMTRLRKGQFAMDAVVSFYAVFHIPRELHPELFCTIRSFIPAGGLVLVTMGSSDWEGTENFHGAGMFWSHYGAHRNREIIKQAGFAVLMDEIDQTGGENHQVILAKGI